MYWPQISLRYELMPMREFHICYDFVGSHIDLNLKDCEENMCMYLEIHSVRELHTCYDIRFRWKPHRIKFEGQIFQKSNMVKYVHEP